MCFDSPQSRDAVREAGGVDALVSILQGDPGLSVAETAATAVANLCYDNEWNRHAVRVAGGITILVDLILKCARRARPFPPPPLPPQPFGLRASQLCRGESTLTL